jgi:hypothetical protein
LPQQKDSNEYHDPHEWPKRPAIIISTDVLSALLPAAASFYKVALQARQEHKPYALDEHTLIALHIAIDTAARELGVQDQPMYKGIIRS